MKPSSPAQFFAAHLLAEFVAAQGVTDVFIAPGARSQALVIAAGQLADAGLINLRVRLDERSLAFTALGAATSTNTAKIIITTSGTAVANLHPAVLEAHHAGVPLILLTADRPAHLRGVGANQTTNQVAIFGDAVRLCEDVPAPTEAQQDSGDLQILARDLAAKAIDFAFGIQGDPRADQPNRPGPVQLNVCFAEPLSALEPNAVELHDMIFARTEAEEANWSDDTVEPDLLLDPTEIDLSLRTVIIAGPGSPVGLPHQNPELPVLAEPSSGVRTGKNAILGYRRVLADRPELVGQIQQVLVYGKPTLGRQVLALLKLPGVKVFAWPSDFGLFDVAHNATQVLGDEIRSGVPDAQWLEAWQTADRELTPAATNEPKVTRRSLIDAVWRVSAFDLNETNNPWLVLGASRLIREADVWAPASDLNVVSNRGLAGIDGTIATATGVALEYPEAVTRALIGDLTFLHDAGSLAIDPLDGQLNIQVIVGNDHGGTIFESLEMAKSLDGQSFERLFKTPQTADIGKLAVAYGWNHVEVKTNDELAVALLAEGRVVIEVSLA